MFKIKPERVAGVVALSYLVLIPVGAFVLHRRVQILEEDTDALWRESGMSNDQLKNPPLINTSKLKRVFGVPSNA